MRPYAKLILGRAAIFTRGTQIFGRAVGGEAQPQKPRILIGSQRRKHNLPEDPKEAAGPKQQLIHE
ncbi:hypothetical protein RA26_00660 [Leisingera sp. ANG-M7]|nr:hypothetical protein RA26_00660 [Leisingera sp. ANG-M7]